MKIISVGILLLTSLILSFTLRDTVNVQAGPPQPPSGPRSPGPPQPPSGATIDLFTSKFQLACLND